MKSELSPVMAMVSIQVKSRSQIRAGLVGHIFEYSTASCFCGASCPTDDLWAEHVLDELFNDEEEPANDDAVQPEPSL